ncbi:MAG: phosphate ABC transporter permease PstA [Bacilli bacterium]
MRKIKDNILNAITYLCALFGILILVLLLIYIFSTGASVLSFKLLTSDYESESYSLVMPDEYTYVLNTYVNSNNSANFSTKWGIELADECNTEGVDIVTITYIDEKSPFMNLIQNTNKTSYKIAIGSEITTMAVYDDLGNYISVLTNKGAAKAISYLDQGTSIYSVNIQTGGGGIRGSLIATLLLIITTLVLVIPLGVMAAIYLNELAKPGRITNILKSMIDMISGIPSIIFGFVGLLIFVPFIDNTFSSSGGSILSGALTMSVMLLPVVIKTTEESLKTIPNSYRNASIALGATKTQTIFKVVLPNAIAGILSATLLSIGRVIGESAALIIAIGTVVKDKVTLTGTATPLSVHIWTIMQGENPNYEVACAISIVILSMVLILNLSVKLLSKKLNKGEAK